MSVTIHKAGDAWPMAFFILYFTKKTKKKITNTHLLLSIFRHTQVAQDACHIPIIGTPAEVPVIAYQVCYKLLD